MNDDDPADMSTPLIDAHGLTKSFPRGPRTIDAVRDLDLTLVPGELVALTGPSLSGKTTAVELLAGWQQPDSGSLRWIGDSPTPPCWPDLTVVPQGLVLLEELTVLDNVLLADRIARRRDHATHDDRRLDELLATLGLHGLRDRGAFEISVGERQRTMVARALIEQPRVVLADEPVAHQDPRHAATVLQLLRATADAGAAVLVTTRHRPEIPVPADRKITLDLS